jgi:hypothetical protein
VGTGGAAAGPDFFCLELGDQGGRLGEFFADRERVMEALSLFLRPGEVVEMRALSVTEPGGQYARTHSGYFDDIEVAVRAAERVAGAARGVYFTPNPVLPALRARSHNRLRACGKGDAATGDAEVARRRWLLIDLDPVRPSGISSSDEEHRAAIMQAYEIAAGLAGAGWPDPIVADSGNGAHLLYTIDLPNDAHGRSLVERVLAGLAFQFDTPAVRVDRTTFNAARIWKLYGTWARKGENTAERPHRLARLLWVPPTRRVVSEEQLIAVAEWLPKESASPKGSSAGFDLDAFIARHGLDVGEPSPWNGGRRWVFNTCPYGEAHAGRPAYLIQFASGAIAAGCLSCGEAAGGWPALRARYEPPEPASLTPTGGESVPSVPSVTPSVRGWSARELIAASFPPTRWAVEGLIAEGLTLLCGAPKVCKSWLCLQWAIAVAAGGVAMGSRKVSRGAALYAALEDTPRRLRSRLLKLLVSSPPPDDLDLLLNLPRLGEGGLEALERWLNDHPNARLIIIDTLVCVRSRQRGKGDLYTDDYDALAALKRLADRFAVAIVVVHHTRKMSAEDRQDMVSGTNGLAGAADTTFILVREESGPVLYGRGRDVEEIALSLSWEPSTGLFSIRGDLRQPAVSAERREILDLLTAEETELTPKQIAAALGKNYETTKTLCQRLLRDGFLTRGQKGALRLASPTAGVTEGTEGTLSLADCGAWDTGPGDTPRDAPNRR